MKKISLILIVFITLALLCAGVSYLAQNIQILSQAIATALVSQNYATTDFVSKQVSYQNEKINVLASVVIKELKKPTYEELKSHSVFIIGCSNKDLKVKNANFRIEDEEGFCWGGTGSVIKITDNHTYILTNNHVAGKEEENVKLYIENGKEKIAAEVVRFHDIADMAVIRIQGKLDNKTAIPGIATVDIQDKVYVVGNPLAVKNVYTEGVMVGYEDNDMLLQLPCIFGNSGSGIFNKDGNLVGLVYALENYPGFLGIPMARITHTLAVDNKDIKRFLKELRLYND